MSSTTNVQNLLVNVFRPVYTYDPTTTSFTPKLELSNIDTYSGNTVSLLTASVGDANSNVYVGSNAGNPYSTLKACQFVSAFGYAAGSNISNVSNSVFVGYNAGAGTTSVSSNVIIGANATGNGSSNVRIGSSNTGTGSYNVSVGTLCTTSTYSNCVVLGNEVTATADNQFRVGSSYLWGNLSTRWLGIGTSSAYDSNNKLDVSGNLYVFGQQGINKVPTRTLDVNGDFRASDANGTLDFHLGVTSSSNGFASRTGTLSMAGGGDDQIIGPIKKGIIAVSSLDTGDSANRASALFFAYTTSNVSTMSSASNGYLVATISNTDLKINSTNPSAASVAYSVTYFPLP